MRRMRLLALTLALSLVSLPAEAGRHKRRRHASPAPAPARSEPRPSASERNAQDYARAEAQLADLRAGRVDNAQSAGNDSPTDIPAQTWVAQENDGELPAPLRQKKH